MTTPPAPHWEHFPHQADMGVRGVGATREQAFEQAALALTAVITDPAGIGTDTAIEIHCQAPDHELLLVDWLNAIVYEMATRHMLFSRFDVTIAGTRLDARIHGEALDPARHQPAVEVKGATYTGLRVAQEADGRWIAQTVVDV
jgi:SHS2 domain-containing protein